LLFFSFHCTLILGDAKHSYTYNVFFIALIILIRQDLEIKYDCCGCTLHYNILNTILQHLRRLCFVNLITTLIFPNSFNISFYFYFFLSITLFSITLFLSVHTHIECTPNIFLCKKCVSLVLDPSKWNGTYELIHYTYFILD